MSSLAAGCLGPLVYFMLALLPVVLKWAAAPRFVVWSWWQATAMLWAPCGMLLVLALFGLLLEKVQGARSRPN